MAAARKSRKSTKKARKNPAKSRSITKAQAVADFRENWLPGVIARYGNDAVAIRTAWIDYLDHLERDRLVTKEQTDRWSVPTFKVVNRVVVSYRKNAPKRRARKSR